MSNLGEAIDFFRVGGTLRPNAESYVVRAADEELPRLVMAGQFCYVLTARQMGKSSLMVRTARRLKAQGIRTAIVELTQIGTQGGVDAWYLSLISQIHSQLELVVDYDAWWKARSGLSPVQRFSDFLRQIVLEEIPGQVVIFVDEIDTTLKLDFSDDFFAAIRAVYNLRASDPAYERLTFVLLGVAMPGDLIEDRARTPFNIGQGVALQEFSSDEGEALRSGLEIAHPREGVAIYTRIYDWTQGHPYLTQKLCAATVEEGDGDWTEARVDALVEQGFFAEEASRRDSNLQFIRDWVQASPDSRRLLRVYRQVQQGKQVPDEERSRTKSQLKLFGLVKANPQGMLVVRNPIYERVFDADWIKEAMPRDLGRRVVVASVLVAVLAIAVAAYLLWQQQQQTSDFHAEQFRGTTSADVRVTSLAGLMALSGSEGEARRLFFEELTPDEQVAMFGVSDPQGLQEPLVVVIQGLYTKLEDTPQNNTILEAMVAPLVELDDAQARNLTTEIVQWLEGRAFQSEGTYQQAVHAYDVAISLNDGNPGTHFDRALSYAGDGQLAAALSDLEAVVQIDSDRRSGVEEVVNANATLFTYLGIHRDAHPALAPLFPTLTPTPTPTATPTPTFTPRLPTATQIITSLPPTSTPTDTPLPPTVTPTPPAPSAVEIRTRDKDGMEMVYVPAGEFLMGMTEDADARPGLDLGWSANDERPQHAVYLDAFWIDRTEVTNAQYARFLNEIGGHHNCGGQGCSSTKDDKDASHMLVEGGQYVVDSGFADHPMIEVTWYGAQAYCDWAEAQLPAEAEWEKAARGTDGRVYPWGNSGPDCNKAQYKACEGRTVSVGSKPAGASPYGALDMAGNVAEWVADWYDGDYYSRSPERNPEGPASGGYRVLRGGSWDDHPKDMRSASRGGGIEAFFDVYWIGFRCAQQ